MVDANGTVAQAVAAALCELARRGGCARIAWEMHRLDPEPRRARMARFSTLDRPLHDRLERMLRNEDLMSHEDPGKLRDDGDLVRASEEGVEWEVLTGPPAPTGPMPVAPASGPALPS
jgi:hypothetical protein